MMIEGEMLERISSKYLPFLRGDDRRLLLHIHWRTDASMSGLVEQFIGARQVFGRIEPLTGPPRDEAVDDLIALVRAVDAMLLRQAEADADHFAASCNGAYGPNDHNTVMAVIMGAYRWRYIVSTMRSPVFMRQLATVLTAAQMLRVAAVLEPMIAPLTADV
jgi:hypothetical protein